MHNLFLKIKLILAGSRLDQAPPAQGRNSLGTCSEVRTSPTLPALTRNSQVSSNPLLAKLVEQHPHTPSSQTTASGQPGVQPAHPMASLGSSLLLPPSCPSPQPSAQHTLFPATPSVPLACSLHTGFLKSSFPNLAFQEEQQGAGK